MSYSKEQNLVTRVIAGETLIVPIRNHVGELDSVYTLNEVGSRIWQLIDGKTPAELIIAALTSEYEVAEDEAARDLQAWLEELAAAGLIVEQPTKAGGKATDGNA
jgi:hypothetical protein